jgi:hypothetical protein
MSLWSCQALLDGDNGTNKEMITSSIMLTFTLGYEGRYSYISGQADGGPTSMTSCMTSCLTLLNIFPHIFIKYKKSNFTTRQNLLSQE